jgi:hypothetical protein
MGLFAGAAAAWLIAPAALTDAALFQAHVNSRRTAIDQFHDRRERQSDPLPAGLAFMIWDAPPKCRLSARDLTDIVRFMERTPGNFLLIGDSSILYGLSRRPPANPALWFHSGLATPWPGTPEFARYEERLLENVSKHDVRFVITEGEMTWMGIRLSDFPAWRRG